MGHVSEEITVHAAPEKVWELAGDPGRIADWLPALTSSRLDGDQRHCTLQEGGELNERIIARSDAERSYTYEIVDGPLPVTSYRSTLSVSGHEDHAHVTWAADFEAQEPSADSELEDTLGGMYQQGLAALRDKVESTQS